MLSASTQRGIQNFRDFRGKMREGGCGGKQPALSFSLLTPSQWDHLLKEIFFSSWRKFFSLTVDPFGLSLINLRA